MRTNVKLSRFRTFNVGRYGARSEVTGRVYPMHDMCWCESRACAHASGEVFRSCKGRVGTGPNGTVTRPWMEYVGAVCVPCAVRTGGTYPSIISAPYGTLSTPVSA